MQPIRCLIIDGPDRGTMLTLPYYRPEVCIVSRKIGTPRVALEEEPLDSIPPDNRRVYRACFHSVDRTMALYSPTGAADDFLRQRDFLMPVLTDGKMSVPIKGEPIYFLESARIVIDWKE